MDYTRLFNELKQASSFDLYRLRVLISRELKNEKRLQECKTCLSAGQAVSYFCDIKNRLVQATLLEILPKKVLVLDHEAQKRYRMPYYMLNVAGVDTHIHSQHNKEILTANNLSVGDHVGFHGKQGERITGVVKRLNQKTVSVLTQRSRWRVGYSHLYRVYEGEVDGYGEPHALLHQKVIEGEIVS